VTNRPPEYKPPPRRYYTDLGWAGAALTGPVTFLAAWIYCAVTWGFLFGFFLGWIPALILALVVAVATIYLWPLLAAVLLYVPRSSPSAKVQLTPTPYYIIGGPNGRSPY